MEVFKSFSILRFYCFEEKMPNNIKFTEKCGMHVITR